MPANLEAVVLDTINKGLVSSDTLGQARVRLTQIQVDLLRDIVRQNIPEDAEQEGRRPLRERLAYAAALLSGSISPLVATELGFTATEIDLIQTGISSTWEEGKPPENGVFTPDFSKAPVVVAVGAVAGLARQDLAELMEAASVVAAIPPNQG